LPHRDQILLLGALLLLVNAILWIEGVRAKPLGLLGVGDAAPHLAEHLGPLVRGICAKPGTYGSAAVKALEGARRRPRHRNPPSLSPLRTALPVQSLGTHRPLVNEPGPEGPSSAVGCASRSHGEVALRRPKPTHHGGSRARRTARGRVRGIRKCRGAREPARHQRAPAAADHPQVRCPRTRPDRPSGLWFCLLLSSCDIARDWGSESHE
jgi:hypothetical protein